MAYLTSRENITCDTDVTANGCCFLLVGFSHNFYNHRVTVSIDNGNKLIIYNHICFIKCSTFIARTKPLKMLHENISSLLRCQNSGHAKFGHSWHHANDNVDMCCCYAIVTNNGDKNLPTMAI